MARLRVHKTSFAAGEVSPLLLGRRDLRAYENGASALRNVFVHPEEAFHAGPVYAMWTWQMVPDAWSPSNSTPSKSI